MKIPATRKGCVELINDMYKEIRELEEIVAGARANEEELLDYIDNISAIIAYQCSLKDQDLWMADMIRQGLYKPDKELLDILKEDNRYNYTDDDDEDEVFGLA